jgi:hypothetical protein
VSTERCLPFHGVGGAVSAVYVSLLPLLVVSAASQEMPAQEPAARHAALTLENGVLRVSLSPENASLTVLDKRIGLVWKQEVRGGFRVAEEAAIVGPDSLSAKIVAARGTSTLTLALAKDCPYAFDLLLDVPDRHYTLFPGYPFPFAAPPGEDWYYVQNTSGEGMLMPWEKMDQIKGAFDFGGSQPWWGITDLHRAMRARLDTFRLPGGKEETVYAVPLRINYAFFTEGGYVGLAKEYRNGFLRGHPEMRPLAQRMEDRPAVGHLKDGVYVYFWGKDPAEDLKLVTEMKAAGIQRGIAVFYGRHEINRSLCDGIKRLGWVVGRYQMPTGNLFQVSKKRHWPSALLTGKLAPDRFFAGSNRSAWDRVCGKQVLQVWPNKARTQIDDYGLQLFYFDTLVVQLAPCLKPDHPSTIEENQQARREIMRRTRELGVLVGSGEGNCPTWALPEVDFFEGLMSLRTYSDIPLSVPAGGFAKDFGNEYREQATTILDETRRIPLYQLGFHDYVAGTWVWRDTNFQSTQYTWKKDLFNILYGTMPMWHIDARLWASHKTEMIASYRKIASVRNRIGFAEMIRHGWLTADRSVQFTDWDTGDRVIVNFGDRSFARGGKEPLPPRCFTLETSQESLPPAR